MFLDLIVTLMMRDGISEHEAREKVAVVLERVLEGDDPETVLMEELALNQDYLHTFVA